MKLKTNEETTRLFEEEEKLELKLLQGKIETLAHDLRIAQNKHRILTGKRYTFL